MNHDIRNKNMSNEPLTQQTIGAVPPLQLRFKMNY